MYDLSPTYSTLRKQAFDWKDERVPPGTPVGFVLETGYPEAVFTLVALSEGAVSCISAMAAVRSAPASIEVPRRPQRNCCAWQAPTLTKCRTPASRQFPNSKKRVCTVLLNEGMREVAALEIDFGEGRSPFSPLFHAAHRLIGEIWRIELH